MSKVSTRNEELITGELSSSEKHRRQAIEYKKLASLFTKNNMIGIFEMLATLGPLYYISTEAPFAKSLGLLCALLAVFFMAKDYTRSKNLDEKVVQLVLDGLEVEKRKPSFDRFFHKVLDEFSVVKILVSRCVCTVLCVFFISTSMGKIYFGKDSVDRQYEIIMGLIGATLGAITCILYYSSYKKFDELKN